MPPMVLSAGASGAAANLDGPPPLPGQKRPPGQQLQDLAGQGQEGQQPAGGQESSVNAVMEKHMFIEQRIAELAQILPNFAPIADQMKTALRQGIAQALQAQATASQPPQDQAAQFLGTLAGGQ